MADNTTSKLLVSEAEASKKIRDRINIGKELHNTQISTIEEVTDFERVTEKWVDYNKTLFHALFDKSPLPITHGKKSSRSFHGVNTVSFNIMEHKEDIADWINELESIYDQLDIYTDLPNNPQQTMNQDTMNNENKKIFIGHGGSHVWRELKDFIVETLELDYEEFNRISAVGKPTS